MCQNSVKSFVGKILSVFWLFVVVIVSYLCVSHRKNDWITGSLIVNLAAVIIAFQAMVVIIYFFTNRIILKVSIMILEILIALSVIYFYSLITSFK